jgi:hypothetical protein
MPQLPPSSTKRSNVDDSARNVFKRRCSARKSSESRRKSVSRQSVKPKLRRRLSKTRRRTKIELLTPNYPKRLVIDAENMSRPSYPNKTSIRMVLPSKKPEMFEKGGRAQIFIFLKAKMRNLKTKPQRNLKRCFLHSQKHPNLPVQNKHPSRPLLSVRIKESAGKTKMMIWTMECLNLEFFLIRSLILRSKHNHHLLGPMEVPRKESPQSLVVGSRPSDPFRSWTSKELQMVIWKLSTRTKIPV